MSWALIDDQSTFHAKVISAGNAAWGACIRMVAWSCAHLTDGAIPSHVAKLIASDEEIEKMITTNLLDRTENGFEIHSFLEWNKSAKQIRKERAAKQKAGKNGGLASGKRRKQTPSRSQAQAEAPASGLLHPKLNPSPLPSSPLQSSPNTKEKDVCAADAAPSQPKKVETKKKQAKPHRLPDEWEPTREQIQQIRKRHQVDPVGCIEKFKLHWGSSGGRNATKVDWNKAFVLWVLNDKQRGGLPAWSPPQAQQAPIDYGPPAEMTPELSAMILASLTPRTLAKSPSEQLEAEWFPKKELAT